MSRTWLAASVMALATLVLIANLPPDSRLPVARFAIFGAGLVVVLRVIRRVAPATASATDLMDIEPTTPATPTEVASLRRIEFDVHMATVHPFGIQWVRPLLRELANGRLRRNRGIDMERDAVAARHVFGDQLSRLIGPDGAQWTTDEMRVSVAELSAGVTRLEQI